MVLLTQVWFGKWGHIPVAVKLLKMPLDEHDPQTAQDFDREVTFMQEIRHPNLLTLYGAGVGAEGSAFLVVEYMSEGSMRTFLQDHKRQLSW